MKSAHVDQTRLKGRLIHELKEFLATFLFLALFFGAFTDYRRIVLREAGLNYYHYGFAVVQALILAKVILIGQYARLGRIFDDRPLIIPTLCKVFAFSLLTLLFGFLEHLIDGWIHGKGLSAVFHEIATAGWDEVVARALIILTAFIPFFAFKEIERALGEGKLAELFLHRKPGPVPSR